MPRTTRSLRRLPVALIVATAALGATTAVAATTGTPRQQTVTAPLASGGQVVASISYTPRSFYDANLAMSITRNGTTATVPSPITRHGCHGECRIEPHALQAVDLLGNGDPVVLLDLFTGGAHCCSITDFYQWNATTNRYDVTGWNWGDPGYSLRTIAGAKVFETADDRFAYAFTDYAASGLPINLYAYGPTGLTNVTRKYPELIAADAKGWISIYRHQAPKYEDTVGVIAAWAADEDELGHAAQVNRFLTHQAAAGHLQSGLGTAGGRRYLRNLNRFLRRTGYLG